MVLSPVLVHFLRGGALLAPSGCPQRIQNLLGDLRIIYTHIDTKCYTLKGYSDTDIRKITGENLLRVMRANEAVSRQMANRD